jgi:hypothetical protein
MASTDYLLFQDTGGKPVPGSIVPCLLCATPFIMPHYTGEPDQICAGCWSTYNETARVVCAKCRVTVCRARPGVTESGYVIRPRSVLHIDACNVCKPGLLVSTVIEIAEWERTMRPSKTTIIVPPRGLDVKKTGR